MSILLQEFDYARPTNLEDLHDLVSRYQKSGQTFAFAAGGTNLVPLLKNRLFKLDHMISLSGLDTLNQINRKDDLVTIGALTTLDDVANSPLIKKTLPALAHAAHKVASPQIRNRATLGGNIMVDNRCSYINQSQINRESHSPCFKAEGDVCHLVKSARRGDETLCQARFVSDTAPVLLLVDTMLNIIGPDGNRKMMLKDLYLKDGIDSKNLKQGEIITNLEIKIPEQSRLHYEKLTIRNALDFPALGVAAKITGKRDLAIALTGLNTLPGFFETSDENHDSFDDMVSYLCQKAMDFAVTYNQDFLPRAYRKSMIPVLIKRAISHISEGAA